MNANEPKVKTVEKKGGALKVTLENGWSTTGYGTVDELAERLRKSIVEYQARIAKLASNGREWLKAEAAKEQAIIARHKPSYYDQFGGSAAEIARSRLADLRAAWKIAAVRS